MIEYYYKERMKYMRKEQLFQFVEVIDCGSINKAAEKLYISQPNLSRSIHALEEEMGKQILERNNRGVTLTPTGKLLYYYSKSILEQFKVLERIKELDEDQIYSQLSISVDSIFLRDDLILNFYKRINSAETEIKFLETTAEEVLQNVIDMKSEIGITILNDIQLTIFKKMAEIKDIEIEILGTGPLYVHINENNPLSQKEEIDVKDLLDFPLIHLPYDFFSELNFSLTIDDIPLKQFKTTITMSNYQAIINMINHANAIMLGNKWQIEELKHSHIKSLQFKNCHITKSFVIIKRKRTVLSNAAKIFLDIIYDNYSHM